MCFSSSPLITTSHTLLPGPPQRKLNAASSVWYPTPSKFVRFHCCWDTVVYFKHPAPEDPHEGHIFPLCFLTFPLFFSALGNRLTFFLHHKMCPSGHQKLEQCNTVIHAFCFEYYNRRITKKTPHHLIILYKQSPNVPDIFFLLFFCKYKAYSQYTEKNRFFKKCFLLMALFAHVFYNAGDITLLRPELFPHKVNWNFMHI